MSGWWWRSLPPDSPLWSLPNVLLSPHTAGLSTHENERIVALFCENLHRYLIGAELLSRVFPDTVAVTTPTATEGDQS